MSLRISLKVHVCIFINHVFYLKKSVSELLNQLE